MSRHVVRQSKQTPVKRQYKNDDNDGLEEIGLVASTIRLAIEDARKPKGRRTEMIVHPREAAKFLQGHRFDEMVSGVGADPDAIRDAILRRLPWLREIMA